jgi:hypothetical protein
VVHRSINGKPAPCVVNPAGQRGPDDTNPVCDTGSDRDQTGSAITIDLFAFLATDESAVTAAVG